MNPRRHLHDRFESELCLVGAASDNALVPEVRALLAALEHAPDLPLRDVAFSLAHTARQAPAVLAIVAGTVPELCARLAAAQEKLAAGAVRIRDKAGTCYFRARLRPERGLVFLLPGDTAYYPGMLRDLCLTFDACRAAFDEADAACEDENGSARPGDWLFDDVPTPAMADALLCTHAANTAFLRLFGALGIRPDAVLGHSDGMLAALEYAGVLGALTGPERVRFLREGYRLCSALSARGDLPSGILLSVEDPPPDALARVPARWRGRVAPVMLDSARHTVFWVPEEAVAETADTWRRQGAKVVPLGLRRACHAPAFAPGLDAVRSFLHRWVRHAPRLPVYSCTEVAWLPESPSALLDVCVREWSAPVRFGEAVSRLYGDGFRVFVELGARGLLSMRVHDILDGQPHVAVAASRLHRPDLTQLHHALALLAAHGVAMDATALHAHRGSRLLDLRHPVAAPRRARAETAVHLDATLPEIGAFASGSPFAAAPAVNGTHAPAGAAAALRRADFGADFPMLAHAETVSEKPDERIELRTTVTTDDFPFLRDYALAAHGVSVGQPRLGGLPLLSAITCIEIMAEAARRLAPRKRVVQVDDLRGKRLVTLERGEASLVILAERVAWPEPGTTAVRVSLRTPTADSRFAIPMAEATVFLAALPPDRETVRPAPLCNPRPANWTGPDLYPDRLFQGPLLQSVNHVFQYGDDGLDYEIRVLPRGDAVRHTRIPLFSVWPLLMDGVSSGIGLWRAAEKFNGVLTLPFRARTIRYCATVVPEGARLRAYLRITAQNPHSYVADALVSDGRGRLVMRVTGWEELICPLTPALHRLMLRPSDQFLTQELPRETFGEGAAEVRGGVVVHAPQAVLESQQELWLKATAFALLNPAERDEWLAMRGAASRRIEWLLGRACAKEAVRRHLQERHQQRWASADVPVWTDDSGKPHAHGPWRDRTREHVDISIAHTAGLVAAAMTVNGRIGIDLERIGRDLSDDFSRSVFTAEEQDLAARSGTGPLALLRFWCAKEALAKALGTGIRYSPSDLRVRALDAATGRTDLELAGQWLDAFGALRGRAMPVHTALLEDHILATCVIPATLLPLP